MTRLVAYLRTSTRSQDLGLEAQRSKVNTFAATVGATIIAEFSEQEHGDDDERVELKRAIETCKLTGAKLLVAKQDRISRDAAFAISFTRKHGVEFVSADNQHASKLEIGFKAIISEHELELIRTRTRDALAIVKANIERDGFHVAKRSGRTITRLGGANIDPALGAKGGRAAAPKIKAKADEHARRTFPMIEALRGTGLSMAAIAEKLNTMQIATARGGRWHASSVRNVLERH